MLDLGYLRDPTLLGASALFDLIIVMGIRIRRMAEPSKRDIWYLVLYGVIALVGLLWTAHLGLFFPSAMEAIAIGLAAEVLVGADRE